MSERAQQDKTATITPEEYEAARPWRAFVGDLIDALDGDDVDENDAKHRGQFTLRLIDPDGSGAFDTFVTVIAADELEQEGSEGPVLVTVRPDPRAGEASGRLMSHMVSSEGFVTSGGEERGYFVGGEGIGGDEIGNFAMVLRTPLEQQLLKAEPMPLPEEY